MVRKCRSSTRLCLVTSANFPARIPTKSVIAGKEKKNVVALRDTKNGCEYVLFFFGGAKDLQINTTKKSRGRVNSVIATPHLSTA